MQGPCSAAVLRDFYMRMGRFYRGRASLDDFSHRAIIVVLLPPLLRVRQAEDTGRNIQDSNLLL